MPFNIETAETKFTDSKDKQQAKKLLTETEELEHISATIPVSLMKKVRILKVEDKSATISKVITDALIAYLD